MLCKSGFDIEKRQAKLLQAKENNEDTLFSSSFSYYSDVANQWEDSYSNEKLLALFNSQSIPSYNITEAQAWLGERTSTELDFCEQFSNFYSKLAKLISSSNHSQVDVQNDCLETLVDNRLLGEVTRPLKILDIGGGAGRHFVSTFLNRSDSKIQYVGIESIAMCYQVQNLVGSMLSISDNLIFNDLLDYKLAHKPFPDISEPEQREAFLLPLWLSEHLPDNHFDLILCNHVLDELPPGDFDTVIKILKRTLAPSGSIYCRGSQQKASLKDLYPLGGGTYHGKDITQALKDASLQTDSAQLVAGEFTRVLSHKAANKSVSLTNDLLHFDTDVQLNQSLQTNFIQDNVDKIRTQNLSMGIWGEAGFTYYNELLSPHVNDESHLDFTHRFAFRDTLDYPSFNLVPKEQFLSNDLDVIVIAAQNPFSIIRELQESLDKSVSIDVKMFSHPIAFVYIKK